MRKINTVAMLVVLLSSFFIDIISSVNTIIAYAEDGVGQSILDRPGAEFLPLDKNGQPTIFTNTEIRMDGYPVEGNDIELSVGDLVEIYYTFSIPDELAINIQENDFFKFKLVGAGGPITLGENQSGTLRDKDTRVEYGKYEATPNGDATIIFNDEVHGHDNISGQIYFTLEIDESIVKETGPYEVRYPSVENSNNTIIHVTTPNLNSISKEFIKTTGPDEAQVLQWSVLVNPNKIKIENPVLHEVTKNKYGVEAALAYNIDKVTLVKIGLKGQILEETEVAYDKKFDANNNLIMDNPLTETYMFYISTPMPFGTEYASNEATISGSNITSITAKATTDMTKIRGLTKEATSYDKDSRLIDWTIVYNPDEKMIPQEHAKFTDTLDDNQTYIEDSLKVTPSGIDYTVTPKSNGFEFDFNQDISETVVIKYQTKVKDGYWGNVKNSALTIDKEYDSSFTVPKDETPPDPNPEPGDKHNSEVIKTVATYKPGVDDNLKWTMKFNHQAKPEDLLSWSATDTLDNGEMLPDTFVLTDATTNTIVDSSDYTIKFTKIDGKIKRFDLTYDKPTNHAFTVYYESRVMTESKVGLWYNNDVEYTYHTDRGTGVKKAKASKWIERMEETSLAKSGRLLPGTNQVEWTVKINIRGKYMNGQMLIVDPIPNGQTFVPGSIETTTMDWENSPLKPNAEVRKLATFNEDKNQIEFRLGDYPKALDTRHEYDLIFRTTLDDINDVLDDEVKNTAYFSDRFVKDKEVDGKLELAKNESYFVKKEGALSSTTEANDEVHLDWKVTVNENKFRLRNVELLDDNWVNQKVLPNTIKITQVSGDEAGRVLVEEDDYKLDLTERQFSVKFNEEITETYEVEYTSDVLFPENAAAGTSIPVKNGVILKADNIHIKNEEHDVTIMIAKPKTGGTTVGKQHTLQITKKDASDPEKILPGAEFELYRKTVELTKEIVDRRVTDENGELKFDKLVVGEYLLVETEAPPGYVVSPELKEGVPITIKTSDKSIIYHTFTNEEASKQTINIPVEKKWEGTPIGQETPEIEVFLLQNGKQMTPLKSLKLNKENNYKNEFKGLRMNDDDGKPYTYTMIEDDIPHYNGSIEPTDGKVVANEPITPVVLTNIYTEELTIKGDKIWNDYNNKFNTRPTELIVYLQRDGVTVDEQVVKKDEEDGRWKFEFVGLEKYDPSGKEYNYTVEEEVVPGYELGESDDYDLVNIYVNNETTNYSGDKIWLDMSDKYGQRPEGIRIVLYQNNNRYKEVIIGADNAQKDNPDIWKYEFKDLPVYDEKGNKYTYTVKEEDVETGSSSVSGYESSKSENIFTNEFVDLPLVEVSGEKIWENDYNNKFNTRPSEITVALLRNNVEFKTQVTNEGKNWKYSFKDLPASDLQGNDYTYTIIEKETVPDYSSKVSKNTGTSENKLEIDITNTYTKKDVTSVSGKKVWDDYSNKFNTRPSEITVELYQSDSKEVFKSQVVKAKVGNIWEYEFKDLPKYDVDGNEYIYTVKEVPVNDYTSVVNGNNLQNTYVNDEKTKLDVTKKWENDEDYLSDRPDAIKVTLLRDDAIVNPDGSIPTDISDVTKITLSDANQWHHTFLDLVKYDDSGNLYKYSVMEDTVPKYEPKLEVDPLNTTGIILTNRHTEMMSISGRKIWDDYDDLHDITASNIHPNTRPNSVEIELLRNNQSMNPIKIQTVSELTGWRYTFKGLDVLDENGEPYTYSVKEVTIVPGYDAPKVDGNNIINRFRSSEKVSINILKEWEDYVNQFKTRPKDLKFELYRNHNSTEETITLNEANDWKGSFKDLPKYDEEGVLFEYDVIEEVPELYEPEPQPTVELESETADETVYKYSFKNTYVNTDITEIKGAKRWEDYDNAFKTRPDKIILEVRQSLKKNDYEGEVVRNKIVTGGDENSWSYAVKELPKYNEKGDLYYYTVTEQKVFALGPDGVADITDPYTSVKGPGEYDITNIYIKKDYVNFSGEKIWDDYDNKFKIRPVEVIVNLYRDNRVIDTTTASEATDWKYIFTGNYEKYDSKGKEIAYRVEEERVNLYNEPTVDEETGNITNVYRNNAKKDIKGKKEWIDEDDALEIRPASIEVELYRNENHQKTIEVTGDKDKDWDYEFTGLDVYDEDGNEYIYKVKEVPVENYNSTIVGNTITNTLPLIDISGTKTWVDYDNNYKTRPDELTLTLHRNGKETNNKVTITGTGDVWDYKFTNLLEYDENGNKYEYSVEESFTEKPSEFSYNPEKDKKNPYNFINTYTREGKTEVRGEKLGMIITMNLAPDLMELELCFLKMVKKLLTEIFQGRQMYGHMNSLI